METSAINDQESIDSVFDKLTTQIVEKIDDETIDILCHPGIEFANEERLKDTGTFSLDPNKSFFSSQCENKENSKKGWKCC